MKRVQHITLFGFCALAGFFARAENLAAGKMCVFSEPTNYGYCNDPRDAWQLTDGIARTAKDGGGYIWISTNTVGWCRKTGVRSVSVDLGETRDIGAFACNMAAGVAGVSWPVSIGIYVGDDGLKWRYVGDLWAKAVAANGAPPADSYSVYKAVGEWMPCRGRHVMFLFEQEPFTFLDEIEVRPAAPGTEIPELGFVSSPRGHYCAELVRRHVRADAERLRSAAADLPSSERAKLEKGIAAALRLSGSFEVKDADTFETPIPLCRAHADVFRENSRLMRAAGIRKPALWTCNRWENLDPLQLPSRASLADKTLRLEMMRGECRAFALNIANPDANALRCTVSLEGFSHPLRADLAEVLFSETPELKTVASALRFAGEGERLSFEVPAGTSRQTWVSVPRQRLAAGSHRGKIVFSLADGSKLARKVEIVVHDVEMPARPRMHLGGWDYSDCHRKEPEKFAQSRRQMRRIFVDTPFATNRVLPQGAQFDAEGSLLNADKLDFGWWDAWVKLWPDARQFAVFVNPSLSRFFGEKVGSARFERMVGEYYRAFHRHAVKNGLAGRRIVLHLVDEPALQSLVPGIIAWEKALKRGCPELCIMVNPTFHRPAEVAKELFDRADLLCPQMWEMRKGDYVKFYADRAAKGQETWIYSCNGPSRLLSPVSYYIAQAYLAFQMGASGTFFWQFGSAGGKQGSWQAYGQQSDEYSPYFVAPYRAIPAKQGEAIRESLEDFEYLSMLAERIAAARAAGLDTAAFERVLAEAPRMALGQSLSGADDFRLSEPEGWNEFTRHDAAEQARLSVLRAIVRLDALRKSSGR